MSEHAAKPPPREPSGPQPSDADIDLDTLPHCPDCGYILYKLARMRCPECGRMVQPEDLLPPDELQLYLRRQARRERIMTRVGLVLIVVGGAVIGFESRRFLALGYCFLIPLIGTTLASIGFRLYLGESIHGLLLVFGILWLLAAAFIVILR